MRLCSERYCMKKLKISKKKRRRIYKAIKVIAIRTETRNNFVPKVFCAYPRTICAFHFLWIKSIATSFLVPQCIRLGTSIFHTIIRSLPLFGICTWCMKLVFTWNTDQIGARDKLLLNILINGNTTLLLLMKCSAIWLRTWTARAKAWYYKILFLVS